MVILFPFDVMAKFRKTRSYACGSCVPPGDRQLASRCFSAIYVLFVTSNVTYFTD